MDYKIPFFADRGVDPDVAAVRGYEYWDEETWREVVDTTFGDLGTSILAWARYVCRQGEGFTIPRFAPEGYDPVTPGVRPSEPVKLGPPKRHFHPDEEPKVFTDLLPNNVDLAFCSPQRGRTKVYFEHQHGTEGHEDHVRQFHNAAVPATPHGHTFYVHPLKDMRKHVEQTKNRDSHKGVNSNEVHAHQKRAKYLYTPSAKFEVPWPTEHDHEGMTPKQLEFHLRVHHPEYYILGVKKG